MPLRLHILPTWWLARVSGVQASPKHIHSDNKKGGRPLIVPVQLTVAIPVLGY